MNHKKSQVHTFTDCQVVCYWFNKTNNYLCISLCRQFNNLGEIITYVIIFVDECIYKNMMSNTCYNWQWQKLKRHQKILRNKGYANGG